MKTLLAMIALLAVAFVVPASAAKKSKDAPDDELRVVEVNALSITFTLGFSGHNHVTYKVTDATKVTLNGAPVNPRELRAGMLAKIQVTPDRTTVITIDARDAPAHFKHRLG